MAFVPRLNDNGIVKSFRILTYEKFIKNSIKGENKCL